MSKTPEVVKSCRTCEYTHCKYPEFPCRDCLELSEWKFSSRDKWPQFPLKPDPWAKSQDQEEAEPQRCPNTGDLFGDKA